MSTKPSATSEYITPESKPPIRTSKKNCTLHPRVCSLPLHGGGLGRGCEPSSAHPALPPSRGKERSNARRPDRHRSPPCCYALRRVCHRQSSCHSRARP